MPRAGLGLRGRTLRHRGSERPQPTQLAGDLTNKTMKMSHPNSTRIALSARDVMTRATSTSADRE